MNVLSSQEKDLLCIKEITPNKNKGATQNEKQLPNTKKK